jgi:hypothetical protein
VVGIAKSVIAVVFEIIAVQNNGRINNHPL